MVNLSGNVALVTGGSVGKELARGFLDAGADVALIYRNPQRRGALDENFAEFADVFLPIRADLSDEAQARGAVLQVTERFGGVDFLLNSLGGWMGGKKLHEHSSRDLEKMLSIDLTPTFNIMSAVLPIMSEQKFGRIVNFITMQVFGTGAGNSVYAASKSAVLALSKAAAEEYKRDGISVCTVAPTTIDTEANRKLMPDADPAKWVKPGEIVDALLFFCSTGDSMSGSIFQFSGR